MITKEPLSWPTGWPRTKHPKTSRFGSWNRKPTVHEGTSYVLNELRLMKATDIIISTNLQLRKDGLPRSGQITPKDAGVAVYFTHENEQRVLACDAFNTVGDNLHAIGKSVEAMRGLDRWGCSEILNRAFTGFKALPESTGHGIRPWHEVLDVAPNARSEDVIKSYKKKVRELHPDANPMASKEAWHELQNAHKQWQSLKN